MKFQYNDLVIYRDNGMYPYLNNREARVLGYNKRLGGKLLEIEFSLPNTTKTFVTSLNPKLFKKLKDK